jgi:hypothetical protein
MITNDGVCRLIQVGIHVMMSCRSAVWQLGVKLLWKDTKKLSRHILRSEYKFSAFLPHELFCVRRT